MPATKVVNEGEVLRWFAEGKTYKWMVEEYLRKYNIQTSITMWSSFRARNELEHRNVWDEELVPWKVEMWHRYEYPVFMLRAEGRRRAGEDLDPEVAEKLDRWKQRLAEDNTVVHYDPTTDEGWSYVPRQEGDTDLIRPPAPSTPQRRRRSS